jgi:hypothetical protein
VVTHIWKSRWVESMYTLQGKTWYTRHIRFPHQSTYATRTLSAGSPRTWQPFASHHQRWMDPTALEKKAPDTPSSAEWSAGLPSSFPPNTAIEAIMKAKCLLMNTLHQFTGPITPACDRYVQYLLAGANPSVLNQHRQGLQHWRCHLSTYHSPTFPTDGLHFPPKGPARSPV